MTYDPHRTSVMPHVPDQFPITDEMPAVVVGGRKPGRFLAALLLGLLLAAAAVLVAAVVLDNRAESSNPAPVATPAPDGQPTAVFVAPTVGPAVEAEPGFWQVVGVPDGLNVRSGPGTENDVIGALPAGTRHVFSSGERANANGLTWQSITFGAADTPGWVAAQFLSADVAPDPNSPPTPVPTATLPSGTSVVCFQDATDRSRIARVVFTNRTQITGFVESNDGQRATRASIEGELSNGTADVAVTDQSTGATSIQSWTFNPANVVTSNGIALSVVACSSLGLS